MYILQARDNIKRILAWGEAGVGKTTFCSKLAQDWAETVKGKEDQESTKLTEKQRHLLSNIGLVLYIVFRDTEETQSLDDIVQSQIIKAVGEFSFTLKEQKYHRDILLVCDGLDEVSYKTCELLEIIAGKMYSNIRCIVTCRPHVSLGMSLTADAEIRLKGFSKEQARHYVETYFRQKYPSKRILAEQESKQLLNDIESSPDLLEMSVNPSTLQLLCKMFSATGKIAKDRATVFKNYTYILLQQNHIKLHKETVDQTELKNLYKSSIIKAGHLALQGLKQSHLQLVFTKESVIELAGKEMFDIGFVTEVPGHGFEKRKAQFQHKTHQEYLAAYFIVKSADDVGIKYLMEFCSTSKGLMGSQIILTFITSMSKKMGKMIQKKIRELVNSWASEDDISPKDRTSFLLAMLNENKSLTFPLPKEIDINVREYEKSSGWFQRILQKLGKKGVLETFFSFDNRGVEKIAIVLGKEYRLELMKDFKTSQLQEVSVDFQTKILEKDPINLIHLIQNNKNLKCLSMEKLLTLDLLNVCTNSEFNSCLVKSNHLKIIKISNCEIDMNNELSGAFKQFPYHVDLDISGNIFTSQSGCKDLIKNAANLASLRIQDCGIIIDTEIAEAISQLPEQANLDLSGNKVTKMDSSLLCHVIPVISNKKIDLSGLGVVIDAEVGKSLCSLKKEVEVALSNNQIAERSTCISLIHKTATFKSLSICNCGIQINTEIAEAVSRLHDDLQLDLSGNQVTDKYVCITLIHKAATMKSLNIHNCMCNCGIEIDTEIAEAVSQLPEQANLDLSGNTITKMDSSLLCHVIPVISNKQIDLSGLDVVIDDKVAQALGSLHKEVEVDLSGNQITDKSACITLIHKVATIKSLSMCNCGIQIDTEIAEAVSRLPDHTDLDLSGNKLSNMKPDLLSRVLTYMTRQQEIDLNEWEITVGASIVRAMSKLSRLKTINIISPNGKLTNQAAAELPYTVSCMPHLLDLNMVGCDISNDVLVPLTDSLSKHCPLLRILNLSKNCLSSGMEEVVKHTQQMKNLKKIFLSNCGIEIDTEIAKAVSRLPDHTEVDLSGNRFTDKSACITLIRKAATMKSISICNCGIQIDTEIAETVSRLSDHTQLDLAGNDVTKMEPYLLSRLLTYMKNQENINIRYWHITVDLDIVRAMSKVPKLKSLIVNRNTRRNILTAQAAAELPNTISCMHKLQVLHLGNCGIGNDAVVALTDSLSKHCPLLEDLSLSKNNLQSSITKMVKHIQQMKNLRKLRLSSCCISDEVVTLTDRLHKHCHLLQDLDLSNNDLSSVMMEVTKHIEKMKKLTQLYLDECGIKIDREIAQAVSSLSNHTELYLSGNQVTEKSACITLIHKAATMKSLSIYNCGVEIDTEIAEAVSRLPDQTKLDLSGNWVTDKSACITLIHKAATMKHLNIQNCMSNCDIQIDREIAEAVSMLPYHTQLDLSGNQITDKSACITLIHKAATIKSLSMSNCGIQIDTELSEAVSRLPDHKQLDLSGNQVSDKSALITLLKKTSTMKSLNVHGCMSNCGIQIDTEIAEAVSRLPDHTKLDLSGNKITNKSACITLIHKAETMKSLNINNCMSNCGIQIDTDIAEAVSRLPDHTQLDVSGNQVTDKSACITLIHKVATIKSLSMSNCGIQIDTEISEAVSRLTDHTQLDLSGNKVTDKSACITLIHKAATMKSLNIHNCMSNCGIQIDTDIAEAVSRLPDHTQLDLSGNQVTDKSACITLIHKVATIKSLIMSNCGIQIDTEISEAVSRLPDHKQLDLSGNQVSDKSALITLLKKTSTMKSLNVHDCMSNCGIQIDTEIAEAVSRLPDHTQLDLSGNQVTDKSACITLIHKAATMKSLNTHNCMSNCGIQIDTEIVEAVSRLPDHTQLDLSGNLVKDKSACVTLIHKAATMKSLNIHNCMSNCGIKIDTKIAEAVSRLPDHTQLDLSGNQVTDKSACITLIHKAATIKSLSMYNCGIQIDTEISKAVSRLPDHTQLNLSGNQVTDKSACITLIHKAATMKSLNVHDCMSNCGIQIDTEIAEAVSRLPDHTKLDLSGNKITNKSACITLIHKAETMKSLNIHNCMSNCGIQIDTEIAEAVSRLPDHTKLDLSGNQVTDKSACITLIHKAATMKSLNIHNCMSNCGIQIDTDIAEAVSRLPDHTQLDLSGNQVTDKSACITLIHKAATIKSLSICNCGIQIDTKIAETVSRLSDHTQLDLAGNDVTKMEPYLLSRLLTHMKNQENINIRYWHITVDLDIVRAMSKVPKLKSLIVNQYTRRNILTTQAAAELPNTISCMHKLQVLHLGNCGIGNDAVVALTDSLSKHCPLLEDLSLSKNNLQSSITKMVKHIQQMKNLRKLWLSSCSISDEVVTLTDRLHKHCHLLQVLDLSNNDLSSVTMEVTKHIEKMKKLTQLYLNECGIKIDREIAQAVSSLSDHTELYLSGNQVTEKFACITLIHEAATMKSLSIYNCGVEIDTEIAEAVSRLPDQTKLDLSGNKITDKSACITLIHKATTMKHLNIQNCMSNCDIQFDREIAEAVSRLPDHTKLDLSGNKITDKSACITLIHKAATIKSLSICNCGIQIDTEISEAVSRLPDHTQLNLSGNQVPDKSALITLLKKTSTMKSLNVHDCMSNCGIQIDTEIAEAVSRLPDHTQLDLSGNKVTDKSACITLIHKAATMKSLSMSNCGIQIDTEISEAVSRLTDHTQLDLSGNKVTDKSACITLIHKATTMKSLNIHNCMSNCGILIDTDIAEAVSRLPDHAQLDLSGNQVKDKSACITLIHKAATMKSLSICNCGIQIDTEIAEAVSRLPDHTQLYLSGNQVTDKSACITLIHKAATMKSLSICNCGIQIDTEISEAVSRLPDNKQLDLSGNQVSDKSVLITLLKKTSTMKSLNVHDCMSNCGIQIDTEIAEAVSRLPDHTQLDLSGNKITKICLYYINTQGCHHEIPQYT